MNYYNDNDPKACAWLSELMAEGLIPKGEIDQRSIVDVRGSDLCGFTQCHFFAGISGWSLALRLAGWPEDREAWTGSCPCQPLSCAGKGKGDADERHLWPAFYRLTSERRPAVLLGEQVASKAGREWFSGVRADLEGMGYACGGADLCSASVGSPNIRQRLFWVAYAGEQRRQQECRSPSGDEEAHGREGRDGGKPDGNNLAASVESVSRLAHSQHDAGRSDEPGRGPEGRAADGRDCEAGRLADAELRRPEQCDQGQWTVSKSDANGANGGMGDTSGSRRVGAGKCDAEHPSPGTLEISHQVHNGIAGKGCAVESGFWSSAIWHLCRDGKQRRISPEPALFPLAARLPGRVGLLRGAGNAINPWVAKEFIQAVMECV